MKEPLYTIGDKVTSVTRIEGVVKDMYINEVSGEWVYICENILIKESNIKPPVKEEKKKKKK